MGKWLRGLRADAWEALLILVFACAVFSAVLVMLGLVIFACYYFWVVATSNGPVGWVLTCFSILYVVILLGVRDNRRRGMNRERLMVMLGKQSNLPPQG